MTACHICMENAKKKIKSLQKQQEICFIIKIYDVLKYNEKQKQQKKEKRFFF